MRRPFSRGFNIQFQEVQALCVYLQHQRQTTSWSRCKTGRQTRHQHRFTVRQLHFRKLLTDNSGSQEQAAPNGTSFGSAHKPALWWRAGGDVAVCLSFVEQQQLTQGAAPRRAPHREPSRPSIIGAIILCCSQTCLSQVMKVWVKVHSPMGSPRPSPISLIPKLIPPYGASAGKGAICLLSRGVSLAHATLTLRSNKCGILTRQAWNVRMNHLK